MTEVEVEGIEGKVQYNEEEILNVVWADGKEYKKAAFQTTFPHHLIAYDEDSKKWISLT